MNVLNKPITLKLNKHWLPLRTETPQSCFEDMAKDRVRGIRIEYFQRPDETYDFENPIQFEAITWEQWICLKVRSCDLVVHTSRLQIRIPTVVVCTEYGAVPMAVPRLTAQNVYKRDGATCQYTGKKLQDGEWNLDHVIPRAKGGKTTWDNVVVCDRQLNSAKGDKLPSELGLKLIRHPKSPKASPVLTQFTPEKIAQQDWKHFLLK